MNNNNSAWRTHPDYKIEIEVLDKHILIAIEGEILADSKQVLLLREQDHEPVYYFPRKDITMTELHKTTKETFCPFKGFAQHWSLKLKDTQIDTAAWSYENPFKQVSKIKNYIGFYPEVIKHISFN